MTQPTSAKSSGKDPRPVPDGAEPGDDSPARCGERDRRVFKPLGTEVEEKHEKESRGAHRGEPPRIGVLALQGDYAAHAAALEEAGAVGFEVRTAEQLASVDGLVLPGGESTTMLRFLESRELFGVLQEFCGRRPVFGTCAGAILLAREVVRPPQRSLGALDAVVERNAYGRQIDSSIVTAPSALPGGPLEMVFIRAPRFTCIGPEVQALATRDGAPTLVRQGLLLAATFHPELSQDRRIHRLFVEIVTESKQQRIQNNQK